MSTRREVLGISIAGKLTIEAFKKGFRYPITNQLEEYAVLGAITLDRQLRPPEVVEYREPVDQFVVDKLKQFGERVGSWTLRSGIRMRLAFPSVAEVVTLLSETVDPRDYFPIMRPPLKLKHDRLGSFYYQRNEDVKDPRSIELRYPGHKPIVIGWFQTDTDATVYLHSELQNINAGLAILVKEVNQIIDFLDYAAAYLSLARRAGIRIRFHNPTNIPTPQRVLLLQMGFATQEVEKELFGHSSLDEFIDVGSAMKTHDVLATWYQDAIKHDEVGENSFVQRVVRGVQVNSRLLQARGLVKEQFGVTRVNLPPVNSIDFFKLLRNFRGQMEPSYSSPIDKILRTF